MNSEVVRISGAIVSALVIAGALFVALRADGAPMAAPVSPPPAHSTSATAPSAPVALAVRFRGDGPIARAQAMAARGRERHAALRIARELERQPAFDGLCFDGFTRHATEVLLRSCGDVADGERARAQTRWLAALNRMRAIEYANPARQMREM